MWCWKERGGIGWNLKFLPCNKLDFSHGCFIILGGKWSTSQTRLGWRIIFKNPTQPISLAIRKEILSSKYLKKSSCSARGFQTLTSEIFFTKSVVSYCQKHRNDLEDNGLPSSWQTFKSHYPLTQHLQKSHLSKILNAHARDDFLCSLCRLMPLIAIAAMYL